MESVRNLVLHQANLTLARYYTADSRLFIKYVSGGNVKVPTIEGYKSAISATLKSGNMNVGKNPHLCKLIDSFYADRPVERNLTPRWDLAIVLSSLTKSPFERRDMALIDLKLLTLKTVFLLSLGTEGERFTPWIGLG